MSALERENFGEGRPTLAVIGSSHGNNLTRNSDMMQWDEPFHRFSLDEILIATNKFNDALVVGIGGFGKVYKGFIDRGATTVAIKRLNVESKQGVKEFWAEIETLSKFRHTNLVALIGYCNDSQEMILVYEFVAHGTLANHLYNTSRQGSGKGICHLTWGQRLNICIGAARGLKYLHNGDEQSIIHRDVKTTNILLDGEWVAKISDFGLSKSITTLTTITHVSTNVKGTFGYIDPEYFRTGILTKKSDVYSFGVVLLEVLCGRPPVDTTLEEDQINLIRWAQQHVEKGKLDQIVDPSLTGQITPYGLKHFAELANKCLHSNPKERPTMTEVVGSLETALASYERKGISQKMMSKVFQGIALVPKGMDGWRRDSFWERHLFTQQHRRFSLAQIQAATNGFNEDLLIGGDRHDNKVYKGYMDGGTLVVAIQKVWKGDFRFHTVLHPHPNIVSLIGFCDWERKWVLVYEYIGFYDWEREWERKWVLVYEYMGNGSLGYHLHGTDIDPLLWKKRLEICIDAAQGLKRVHTNTEFPGVHGNINPSSILLDDKWVAKVGNFPTSSFSLIESEDLKTFGRYGTSGYFDPAYVLCRRLTEKSDVYSFGIVLLEVLCAKKPVIYHSGNSTVRDFLWERFVSSIIRGSIEQVIDPYLIGKIAPECFRDFVKVALRCLVIDDIQRPTMDDVLGSLQSALKLQEAWENLVGISAELPVTDPSFYNSVFSVHGEFEFRIGGWNFLTSNFSPPCDIVNRESFVLPNP